MIILNLNHQVVNKLMCFLNISQGQNSKFIIITRYGNKDKKNQAYY